MKVYLLIYGSSMGDRAYMKNILNAIPEVVHWRYDIPNCFYIQSESTSQELVDMMAERMGENVKRFLVSEITSNRQGYLSKETWNFIKMKNLTRQDLEEPMEMSV